MRQVLQAFGMKTFAAQDGADLTAAARATDLVQDAQLLLRREGPPAGALGQPGIARRRRRDNGRSTAFCHAGISGGRRLGTIVGHDHETFSRTLKLKLRGNSCLIIIGVEGGDVIS